MTSKRITPSHIFVLFILVTMTTDVLAIRAPTKPLAERVKAAEAVFVGKVVNKVTVGDWVTADLLVEDALVNAKLDQKIAVTWRATLGGRPIYDTAAGSRGIAILNDKHQGRYWLRGDKFEDVKKLAEVKKLIKEGKDVPAITVNVKDLCQHWVHSREEEEKGQADGQIFRPSDSRKFPRSRFRMAYKFDANGSCQWMYLDPADRHRFKPGKWAIDATDKTLLKVTATNSTKWFRITELSKDILRLTPHTPEKK